MATNINDIVKSLEGSNEKLKDLKPTHITSDGVAIIALTGYAVVVRDIRQEIAEASAITVGGKQFTGDSTIGDLLKTVQSAHA